jgi:hypothetical protein
MQRGIFGMSLKSQSMPDITTQTSERRDEARESPLDPPDDDSSPEHMQGGKQQLRRNSTGVISSEVYDAAVNPEERHRKGQCPSCGQQLYQVGKSHRLLFFRKNVNRRKALTVPGLVNRGQCLKCTGGTAERAPGAAAAAEGSHPHGGSVVQHHHHNNSDSNNSFTAGTASVVSIASTTAALYEGPRSAEGERHGKGVMRWANGDMYVGEFYQGARQGTGTLQFVDGSEYVGDWWNNDMHGSGTRRFVNGDIYVGDYRYSRRQGTGRFYFTNGDLYYGNWHEDKMEGFGRYYYHTGQRFEGYFVAGKRHGKGKLQRTDGSLDLYKYEEDKRVEAGVRWSADRSKAWRLDPCRGGIFRPRKVTVAEAVSLVYQIEGARQADAPTEDANLVPMMTLEDTMDSDLPGTSA